MMITKHSWYSMYRLPLMGLLLASVSACSDSIKPAVPVAIDPVSGDDQSVVTGSDAPTPLVVRVIDNDSHGIPNITVTWAVPSDNGTVSQTSMVTDIDGYASVNFIGTSVGVSTVTATTGTLSAADFSLTIVAPTSTTGGS